jgi:hypothetical protein
MTLPNVPTIINPVGVDREISRLQNYLVENIATSDYYGAGYTVYGRVYRSKIGNNQYQPMIHTGNGNYIDLRNSDFTSGAYSFFYVEDDRPFDERYQANIHLVTFMKLDKIFPDIIHRADEEAHKIMDFFLSKNPFGFNITGLYVGLDNVYNGFDVDSDMSEYQPFHSFKFSLELKYNYNFNSCKNF